MKFLQNLSTKIILLLFGTYGWCAAANANYAYSSKVGVDGAGNMACVWIAYDSTIYRFSIQGTYGKSGPWTITNLTDPLQVNANENPVLAVSSSNSANIKAAAAWLAKDINTGNKIIQGVTLSNNGWGITKTFSLNDGSETPDPSCSVSMSGDGQNIVITWTSAIPKENFYGIRSVISNDGGITWNPQNISN